MTDIVTPQRTKAILQKYHLQLKKSLGQNFLTNKDILINIVTAAEVSQDDDVIEIGPGIGALTEQLAKRAHQVLAFEIDQRLIPVLKETLQPYPNVVIINQDILSADLTTTLNQHFDGKHQLKVVANLPYYITTPIMMHLLQVQLPFACMVMMMQKEVAQRLTAAPGTKAYGSLSVSVQTLTNAQIVFNVPRTVFFPQPNVDSAIVRLVPRQQPLVALDEQKQFVQTLTNAQIVFNVPRTVFFPQPNVDSAIVRLVPRQQPLVALDEQKQFSKFVKGCFAKRRKSLWNNLLNMYGKQPTTKEKLQQVLTANAIDPQIRAERLDVNQFVKLYHALQSLR